MLATRDSDIISVKIDYYGLYRWSIYLSDDEETGDRVRRSSIQSAPGWHNMTITHDSGGVGFTVYIDGISLGIYDTEPRGGGTINPDGPINISRHLDPTDNQYPEQYLQTNSIRDIRIYNNVVDINNIVDENGETIPVHYDDAGVTLIYNKEVRIQKLVQQLSQLQSAHFGSSSERYVPNVDPRQLKSYFSTKPNYLSI